ncbi:hypothetical protein ABIF68_011058, partial [Bradyrhizobium japonicum]
NESTRMEAYEATLTVSLEKVCFIVHRDRSLLAATMSCGC